MSAHREFIMPSSRTVKNGIIGALKIIVNTMPNMTCLRIRNSRRESGYAVMTENSMLSSVPAIVIYTVIPKDVHKPLFLIHAPKMRL